MNLEAVFEKYNDEYIKFDGIESKRNNRPDIHAFLLLDELIPGNMDMVSAAEHDEIYLNINCDALARIATEEQILELVRCGVRYDSEYDCLCMFV